MKSLDDTTFVEQQESISHSANYAILKYLYLDNTQAGELTAAALAKYVKADEVAKTLEDIFIGHNPDIGAVIAVAIDALAETGERLLLCGATLQLDELSLQAVSLTELAAASLIRFLSKRPWKLELLDISDNDSLLDKQVADIVGGVNAGNVTCELLDLSCTNAGPLTAAALETWLSANEARDAVYALEVLDVAENDDLHEAELKQIRTAVPAGTAIDVIVV